MIGALTRGTGGNSLSLSETGGRGAPEADGEEEDRPMKKLAVAVRTRVVAKRAGFAKGMVRRGAGRPEDE